jgi:diguanylate cyclase (GGDEF)-like protein
MRRPGDILARYGGEEFFAILPDTDGRGALEVANSARERIESLMLVHAGSDIGIVTVSCGVATADWNDTNLTSEKLIDLSDQALYSAKRLGRNRCILSASGRAEGEQ